MRKLAIPFLTAEPGDGAKTRLTNTKSTASFACHPSTPLIQAGRYCLISLSGAVASSFGNSSASGAIGEPLAL